MPSAEHVPGVTTRGGARPGAGRPKKAADAPPTETQSANQRYAEARAQHETVKVQQRALALKIESGEYVSRAAVRDACATMLSVLAHSVRSIPDLLERDGLPVEWMERVEAKIDAALGSAADDLKLYA